MESANQTSRTGLADPHRKETGIRRSIRWLVVLAIVCAGLFTLRPMSEELGSPSEARTMAYRAFMYVDKVGKDKALEAFSDPDNEEFVNGSLYVFAMGLDGTLLAHPYAHKLIGTSFIGARDFNGVAYGRELVSTAQTDGTGWVDYVYADPVSKKLRRKSTYVIKIDDFFIGCGYYPK